MIVKKKYLFMVFYHIYLIASLQRNNNTYNMYIRVVLSYRKSKKILIFLFEHLCILFITV